MHDTVILGGGIIGLSTAYYLAKLSRDSGVDHIIHIVEPCPQLFSSASGKAGGFIAKDWFKPSMAALGELSFILHKTLAEQNGGRAKWGYSPSISYSLDRNASLQADSDSDHDFDSELPLSPEAELRALEGGEGEQRLEGERNGDSAGRGNGREAPPHKPMIMVADEWMSTGESRVAAAEQRMGQALAASTAATEADSQRPVGAGAEEQAAAELAQANADAETATLAQESTAAADLAKLDLPFWLRAKPHAIESISDATTTAQCNPHQLCEYLLESCLTMGVRLHHPARATRLFLADPADPSSATRLGLENISKTGIGRTIRTGSYDIPCGSLVVAAGCWTREAFCTLFPDAQRPPPIQPLAGYSARLRSLHWQPAPPDAAQPYAGPCHAIFTSDPSGFSPELFTRVGSELWLGGLNDRGLALPADPMDAQPDPEAIERMMAVGRELCGDNVEVIDTGVCFRPLSPTGRPMIARASEVELGEGVVPKVSGGSMPGGVYVASGHGPWGISLSLGTGYVMAEKILGRKTSVDVTLLEKWL